MQRVISPAHPPHPDERSAPAALLLFFGLFLALAGGFWWLIDRNADLRRDNEALRNQIEKREDIDNAVDDVRELDPDQLDRWLRDRASQ